MKIQSLSVVVPNKKCINNCKFCVSQMNAENYKNQLEENSPFYDLYMKDYIKRLEFARDNGCNTVMLTGNSEPQQNKHFLQSFGTINNALEKPFRCVEMQTTGVLLDDSYLRFLRNHVGVSTISLSVSSFLNRRNRDTLQVPKSIELDLAELCASIKKYDFNLRLSINLTSSFEELLPEDILDIAKNVFLADQVTFRVLYTSEEENDQNKWINKNRLSDNSVDRIKEFLFNSCKLMGVLEYGAKKYSYREMSVVIDSDCMSKEEDKDTFKYLILREDCKLYSQWDDKASLIF